MHTETQTNPAKAVPRPRPGKTEHRTSTRSEQSRPRGLTREELREIVIAQIG